MIYTSSSAIYGPNKLCHEQDAVRPVNLHVALKVSNEMLVKQYCEIREIDYTLARVFNMYGGDDNFSIISKIITAVKNKQPLSLINNGRAIRDFIHIDDVVAAYCTLLTEADQPIVNIGSGIGESVHSLLTASKLLDRLIIENIEREELSESTADNSQLRKLMPQLAFKSVQEYLMAETQQ